MNVSKRASRIASAAACIAAVLAVVILWRVEWSVRQSTRTASAIDAVPHAEKLLKVEGRGFLPSRHGFASDANRGKDQPQRTVVTADAPPTADGTFSVSSDAATLQIRAAGALGVPGRLTDGTLVYAGAYDGVDLVAVRDPRRFQLLYVIHSLTNLPEFVLDAGPAPLTAEHGTPHVLVASKESKATFRVEQPVAIDARGVRRAGRYELRGSALRVAMNWEGLQAPVVLDPVVVVPVWLIESDHRVPGSLVYDNERYSRETTLVMDPNRDAVLVVRPIRSQQAEDHLHFFGQLNLDSIHGIQYVAPEPRTPHNEPGLLTDLERQEWARTYFTNGETWEWNGTWSLSRASQLPGVIGASLAYYPATQSIVAFGGVEGHYDCDATETITHFTPYVCTVSGMLGQTYVFDGVEWTTRLHPHPPNPRLRPTMTAFGSGILLFGGRAVRSPSAGKRGLERYGALFPESLSGDLLNDTWFYDGESWKQLPVANPPPAREGAQLVHDERRKTAVLVGGNEGTTPVGEFSLWEFDGTDWRARMVQESPGLPSAFVGRRSVAAFWHPIRQTVMLFGGVVDRFHFCPHEGAELEAQLEQASLDPALYQQLAEDGCLGGYSHDTWEWDGQTLTQLTQVEFGGFDGEQPVFRQVTSSPWQDATAPPVLESAEGGARRLLPWRYDQRHDHFSLRTTLERAHQEGPAGPPVPELDDDDVVVPDPVPEPTIVSPLFGTDLAPQVAFSPARSRLMIFTDKQSQIIETDGASWVDVTPADSPFAAGAMDFYAAAWSSTNHELVLFDPRTAGTWTYENDNWTRQTPTASPPIWTIDPRIRQERDLEPDPTTFDEKISEAFDAVALQMPRMTYDRSRGVAVMLYGQALWEYDGQVWSVHPLPLSWGSCTAATLLAYDGLRSRTVAFGCTVPAETWEWDGDGWYGPGASPYQSLVLRDKGKGDPDKQDYYDLFRWSGTLQLAWTHPDAAVESPGLGGIATTDADGTLRVWDGEVWSEGPTFDEGYRCFTATYWDPTFDSDGPFSDPSLAEAGLPLARHDTMGSYFDLVPMCFFPPLVEDFSHQRVLAFRDGPRFTQELRLDLLPQERSWNGVAMSSNYNSNLRLWSISPAPFELMSAEHVYLHTQTDPTSRVYPPNVDPPSLPEDDYRVEERRVHNLLWPFRVLADPVAQEVRVLTNRGLVWQLRGDPLQGLGDPCETDADCGLGKCAAEGVCCDDYACGFRLCTTCLGSTPGICENVPDGEPDPMGQCGEGECAGRCRAGVYENECVFDPYRPCGPAPSCQDSTLVPGGHCYVNTDTCALPNERFECPLVDGEPDLTYTEWKFTCSLFTQDCGMLGCETDSACRTQCSDASHCDDGDSCTADSCIEGDCVHDTAPDGTSCDDGNACTENEQCVAGTCTGSAVNCDDTNPCTSNSCDPASGCTTQLVAAGTSCSDGDACNGDEECDGAGACLAGTPIEVADTDPCTIDNCDPTTGEVAHSQASEGSDCLASCQPGECSAAGDCVPTGLAYNDDGDPCTLEFCNPETSTVFVRTCAPLDPSVATNILDSRSWLFTGDDPAQRDVTADITLDKAAVIHGEVLAATGRPLANVSIALPDHPEFGQTVTRMDGKFTLVVSGGRQYTVNYELEGYLSARRDLDVVRNDSIHSPTVVLRQPDPIVTPIDLTAPDEFQIAMGSEVSDEAGTRRGTLLFPEGTEATFELGDGTEVPVTELDIRVTEFSVGESGTDSYPAELPHGMAYTYAVELDSDQALAESALKTTFSQPIVYYVDNFLGFPPGTPLPWGSFDRSTNQWVTEPSGVVFDIIDNASGVAEIDIDGDGTADPLEDLELSGITEPELQQLAALYEPGASVWRGEFDHFSTMALGISIAYNALQLPPPPPDNSRKDDIVCGGDAFSTITCRHRVLMQSVPLAGTPFALNYTSERALGRSASRIARLLISEAAVPSGLLGISAEGTIEGQKLTRNYGPEPEITDELEWTGLDDLGRAVQGYRPMRIKISNWYANPDMLVTPTFGAPGTEPLSSAVGRPVALSRGFVEALGGMDPVPIGLGGWTLSAHHTYEPWSGLLRRGDGSVQSPRRITDDTRLVAGRGDATGEGIPAIGADISAGDIVAARDGVVFFRDYKSSDHRIVRLEDELLTTVNTLPYSTIVEGSGSCSQLAVDRQGQVYFVEDDEVVVRVGNDGQATAVYTADPSSINPDAGGGIEGLAVDDAGKVYVAETWLWTPPSSSTLSASVVKKIDLTVPQGSEGRVSIVLGDVEGTTLTDKTVVDGGLARDARAAVEGIATNGTHLFAEVFGDDELMLIRVEADGKITVVAGCAETECTDEWTTGLPARQAQLRSSRMVGNTIYLSGMSHFQVAPNGTTYLSRAFDSPIDDLYQFEMWRINLDGRLDQVLDHGSVPLGTLALGLFDHRAGTPGILATSAGEILQLVPPHPGFGIGNFLLAAADGSEVYKFDERGRHEATLHPLTGESLLTFQYDDSTGYLVSVRDAFENTTTIGHSGDSPSHVTGPFGERTDLTVGSDEYLTEISNPLQTFKADYDDDRQGLLTAFTDPLENTEGSDYDVRGNLQYKDLAPNHRVYINTLVPDTVVLLSPQERSWSYESTSAGRKGDRYSFTDPSGTSWNAQLGSRQGSSTSSHGSSTSHTVLSDPRFGPRVVIPSKITRTPAGLVHTVEHRRSADVQYEGEPFSYNTLEDYVTVNGRTTTSVFTKSTGVLETTSPAGRKSKVVLDNLGRPTSMQVGNLEPTSFTYHTDGRLHTAVAGARSATQAYTGAYLTQSTDPLNQSTTAVPDYVGRTVSTTTDGATTSFEWDANSNPISLGPPGQPSHTASYPIDLLESYTAPTIDTHPTSTTSYTYTDDGQPETVTLPNGSIIRSGYWEHTGQLHAIATPDGQYRYEHYEDCTDTPGCTQGLLSGVFTPDDEVAINFAYDGPLLTDVTWSGAIAGGLSWQHDNDFRVVAEAVYGNSGESSTAVYDYEADGLVSCASLDSCPNLGGEEPSGNALMLTYEATNPLLAGTTLDQVSDSYSYNNYGELRGYAAFDSVGVLYEAGYESSEAARDSLGRIVQKTETLLDGTTSTHQYSYSPLGFLTEVQVEGTVTETYTYDQNGNRLAAETAEGTFSASYNAQDQLLAYGPVVDEDILGYHYTYTANGELETKTDQETSETTTYHHNTFGQLTEVELPDGTTVEYTLDGHERRVARKHDGNTTHHWLYHGISLAGQLDAFGALEWRYVYASKPHVPDFAVRISDGAVFRIITDHLGSPVVVVNAATSEVFFEATYSTFGERTVITGNPQDFPFSFAGGIEDPNTGLIRFGSRDYDPHTGRWIQKEPLGFAGETNFYLYAGGDPINLVDPTGESPVFMATVAVLAGAAVFLLTDQELVEQVAVATDVAGLALGAYGLARWGYYAYGSRFAPGASAGTAARRGGGLAATARRAGGFGWGTTSKGVPYAKTLWYTSAAVAKHEKNHAGLFFRYPRMVMWSGTSRVPGAAAAHYAIEVLAYRAQGMSLAQSLVWAQKSVAATGRGALLTRDAWLAAGGTGVGAGAGTAWALGAF